MPMPALDLSNGKRCPRCKQTKPTDQFNRSNHTIHGFSVYCKQCTTKRHSEWRVQNLEYCRKASKKWRKANPRAAKDHSLRALYGLPLGSYEKMLAAQNGKCAICAASNAGGRGDFHVDHDQQTKQVRGLLCHACNVSIGHFHHDISILKAAIRYLSSKRGVEG